MKRVFLLSLLFGYGLSADAGDVPEYRLPAGIEPLSQVIELILDPARADYSGSTSIELDIKVPTERIGINQVGLLLTNVELLSGQGSRALEASEGAWERAWMSDGMTIEPGIYTLRIEFSGRHATDALGMHRVRFEGHDYIFTQFEAMYARRAFPALDEPSCKIPFQLIINAPDDLTVVANTPVEVVERDDGWQRVTFLRTPPLPSYLVAYAVGPLDRVAIEGLSVPGHVYVPKGHAAELGFVLRHTPRIVAALEAYFGTRYPFRKLDFVAVPEFAFGAMENPGLITYRTDALLVGDKVSGRKAADVLDTIAHEVAHMWYGDLVTMAWWDDLWLNEAFATWMANTIIETEFPQYETALNLPQQRAFNADQLTSSRAIRAEVRDNDEIWTDVGLKYTKGHALLRMLERYVGHEDWQRAIRRYLREFAWANAAESDLWAVVSEESGLDIAQIAGDHLNQPGFALIQIDESGRVTQQRYVTQGLSVEEKTWHIPMHVKYKADGRVSQTYLLLRGKTGSLDLPSNAEWVFPDAGANGYYRWNTSTGQFYNLVDDINELTDREKIALLDNSEALLNAGSLSMADYLHVVSRILHDPHSLVFLSALEALYEIGNDFVTAKNRAAFSAYIGQALSPRYEEVGIDRREGEREATVQLRPRLVRVLGQFGSNEALVEDAARLVDRYFEAPASVPSRLALEAMRITALHDDGKRYDEYVKAYLDSGAADQKTNILAAMYFDDPDVVRRHLEFSMSDKVQAGDALIALTSFRYVLQDHSPLYDWLEDNFDRVIAKAPAMYGPLLPQILGGSCDRRGLDLLIDFFADRGDIYAASLARAVEADETCIERKERYASSLAEFLARPDTD
jgi:aminopeptidase N